ncbi:MAG TPA: PASTA domain-containing protein [Micromonosporaceae bacterium]|nr:PASTA domain-containing protein [Micromonosporaceae bacterium]
MRRAVVVAVVVAAAVVAVTGCGTGLGEPGAPGPPAAPSSAPALITMPDVVGQNAAVAVDKLTKLGFTDIDLGTVDGRSVVVLPQNWVVKDQSAKPGERLPADAKIVLGCARIGERNWPFTGG